MITLEAKGRQRKGGRILVYTGLQACNMVQTSWPSPTLMKVASYPLSFRAEDISLNLLSADSFPIHSVGWFFVESCWKRLILTMIKMPQTFCHTFILIITWSEWLRQTESPEPQKFWVWYSKIVLSSASQMSSTSGPDMSIFENLVDDGTIQRMVTNKINERASLKWVHLLYYLKQVMVYMMPW